MENTSILTSIDDLGRATIVLNRPKLHNALDGVTVTEMISELRRLEEDDRVRVVSLTGNGRNFCAGADLSWMRRMANSTLDENIADAENLAELFRLLNTLKKPTVAVVQGGVYGGGVGMVACCDIAISTTAATFCLSETKLGFIPALISPYLVSAIGVRASRRYFQSSEPFNAAEAHRIGLVHEVADDPEAVAEKITHSLLMCAPQAVGEAKEQVARVAHASIDEVLINDTVRRMVKLRISTEGKEGLSAFLEKRKPCWVKG